MERVRWRSKERGSWSRSRSFGHNAYLWTDDVDALAEELKERDAAIVEGPVDRDYACRELIVKDCNGLILCFAQRRV